MARTPASRKYQITFNNPSLHDWSHVYVKNALSTLSSITYWCMCDEVGEEGTPHTHVFVIFRNAVEFKTLQKRFYGAHIEPAMGTNRDNHDYIRKEGKWAEDKKKETNLPDTFEEYGELPPDRRDNDKETYAIYKMLKEGASNIEIMAEFPNAMNKLEKIERARQEILTDRYKNEFRILEVTYLFGETGTGKTRSIMEKYGYPNVYRITNYQHPFDGYKGQDVIMFEEFRSSLPISDMLIYLDGYPVQLPCRYSDKVACFTKVYICTNIPLKEQYPNIQLEQPETWEAFKRRIHHVFEMLTEGCDGEDWTNEYDRKENHV